MKLFWKGLYHSFPVQLVLLHLKKFQVLLNLSGDVAKTQCAAGTVVLTTLLDGDGARVDGEVTLEAGEGLLVRLD